MKKQKKNNSELDEAIQDLESQKEKTSKKKASTTIDPNPTDLNEQKQKQDNELDLDEIKNYSKDDKILDLDSPEVKKKIANQKDILKTTELVLNIKTFNKYIDYLPSDFTPNMVKRIFIVKKKMHLPKDAKIKVSLEPNDTEMFLKVIVTVTAFYKSGVEVNQTKIFEPFWIIGFGTYSLIVSQDRPVETKYRLNNMHSFAFAQSQKMKNKKISSKHTNKAKSSFDVEQDFIRARDNKNWYLQQYVDGLNRLKNVEWKCIPKINVNWGSKIINIDLYLKIDKIKQDLRKTKFVYVDSFNVKAANVLEIPHDTKIVDIDSIMYLIALNAIYKNIKVFSYETLYETYKLLVAEIMTRGYKLKPISPSNLATLKIVDFSTHFSCKNVLFNDAILHIMNLMSSQEEYYRMRYAYTLQKDPTLLFSDFIVKEFRDVKSNELSTIIKNQQDKYWKEQLKKIDELNNKIEAKNKDYYINNYNILDLTNNTYKDVESYLMGVIKGEKDEISRISKLGQELLRIEEDPRFTKKESAELRRVAKKLDENYKDLFQNIASPEYKKLSKIKPIKLKEIKLRKKQQPEISNEQNQDQQAIANNDQMSTEGVNHG